MRRGEIRISKRIRQQAGRLSRSVPGGKCEVNNALQITFPSLKTAKRGRPAKGSDNPDLHATASSRSNYGCNPAIFYLTSVLSAKGKG